MKENPDMGITETPVLKAKDTNKIRGIFRGICEIPEKPGEIELKSSKGLKTNGNLLMEIRKRIAKTK